MPFHNVYELCGGVFGIARDARPSQRATVELASHKLFRYSPNGLGLASLDAKGHYLSGNDNNDPVWGVAITGIVEGTEIESSRKLMFPFSEKDFWAAAQSLADELDDAEAEWDAQGEDP